MMTLKQITKYPAIIKWLAIIKICLFLLLSLLVIALGSIDIILPFFLLVIIIGLVASLSVLLIYQTANFVIDEQHLTINSGIIMRKSQTVLFKQVQNVDIKRGILMRIFGLAIVEIRTAVNKTSADGTLVLKLADAIWLKEHITKI